MLHITKHNTVYTLYTCLYFSYSNFEIIVRLKLAQLNIAMIDHTKIIPKINSTISKWLSKKTANF